MDKIEVYRSIIDSLAKADNELANAGKINPEKKEPIVKDIISQADEYVGHLGINSQGPGWMGVEGHDKILGNGGKVDFVILDPEKEVFKNRELFESTEDGRLLDEMISALAGLADSYKRANYNGEPAIYFHDKDPKVSMSVLDPDTNDGLMILNFYPEHAKERGLRGKTYILNKDTSLSAEGDAFGYAMEFFNELKNGSRTMPNIGGSSQDVKSQIKYLRRDLHNLWIKRYG